MKAWEAIASHAERGRKMTNEQILFNVRVQLMEEGKIGSTGRFFEVEDENGDIKKMLEPEEIHSFSRWKEYGYGVKRGEKAIAKVEIWKCVEAKKEEEKPESKETEEKDRMFKKMAFFFSPSQVEPLREGKR